MNHSAILDDIEHSVAVVSGPFVSVSKADALKILNALRAALPLRDIADGEGMDKSVTAFDAAFSALEMK